MNTEEENPITYLTVGTEIAPVDENGVIACWPADKGDFLTKIFFKNDDPTKWFAPVSQTYDEGGIIVFMVSKPRYGQVLKITKVSNRVAFAKPIYPEE